MILLEKILYYLILAGYAVSAGALFFVIFLRKDKWLPVAKRLIYGAVLLHTLELAVRIISTGHLPVKGDFENALAGTWFTMVLVLFLSRRWTSLWRANIGLLPVVLLTLGWASQTGPPDLDPLTPAYNSPWLWVHVFFAWFGYSAFLVAAVLGLFYLVKERNPQRLAGLGDLRALDDLAYRLVAFGFAMTTVMIASGAIWANDLYGSYWSWDPVETWSLLSWLVYGLYLHLRTTAGWQGKKAAWLAVLAFITVLISFWGVNFIQDSYHVFQQMF
ncbi:MAG: c-type cytochrome biogenesis protein CcsB [Firmicutes bacterium]|nr:c-type cytochrome biogenesis protein CcsB [Bacillota bacterium]